MPHRKICFFFDLLPPSVPCCRDYFDVIYSTYRLGLQHGRMEDLWKPENNAILLRLRRKLEDFDQMAGWGPVYAYNTQPGLLDQMLLTNYMFDNRLKSLVCF